MIQSHPTAQERGYPGSLRALHWLSAVLLLGPYAAGWAMGYATTAHAELLMLHRSFGLSVLVLTLFRLVWRSLSAVPPLPEELPAAQRWMARLSAAALYSLLILQPLLGLVGSMLSGARIYVFGNYRLASVLTKNSQLAHDILQIHGWVAVMLLAMIGLHASAALYHHFVRRDGVLAGMLPLVTRRSRHEPA